MITKGFHFELLDISLITGSFQARRRYKIMHKWVTKSNIRKNLTKLSLCKPSIVLNSLRSKCIFICVSDPFGLHEGHIYIHTYGPHSKVYFKVNPWRLSSNRSRPHLSLALLSVKGRKGRALLHEWQWILLRTGKYEAFHEHSSKWPPDFTQCWSTTFNNLKKDWVCCGCKLTHAHTHTHVHAHTRTHTHTHTPFQITAKLQ